MKNFLRSVTLKLIQIDVAVKKIFDKDISVLENFLNRLDGKTIEEERS